jgi:hypothetical protein
MKILVMGYIISSPLGGMVWHNLQYMIGLKRLGHDVLFCEDSGDEPACYSPETFTINPFPDYGSRFIEKVFSFYNLKDQWAYFDAPSGTWYGRSRQDALSFCAEADVVLHFGGIHPAREWWVDIPCRVLLDTDPAFTQIKHLTNPGSSQIAQRHTSFFSFAENIGKPDCTIPDDGFPWQPTRQPFVLDTWSLCTPRPKGKWTTIMQWNSYKAQEYRGQFFGMKSHAFTDFEHLPGLVTSQALEVVVDGTPDLIAKMTGLGWHIRNSIAITRTPWTYQAYIGQSKGEWSVAKHGYVACNSGWFSERSLSYLATGRPVLVQDTGFTRLFETGKGLFAFTTPEEALEGMLEINRDYSFHCRSARAFVETHFEATQVLRDLLNRVS